MLVDLQPVKLLKAIPTLGSPKRIAEFEAQLSEIQFLALIECFPDFPLKMLHCLVIQHNGNFYEIYKTLEAKGWKPRTTKQIYRNEPDPHITTKYYFGLLPSEVFREKLFKGKSIGSFITYYKYINGSPQYFFCSKKDGAIVEYRIDGPNNIPLHTDFSDAIIDKRTRKVSWIPNVTGNYKFKNFRISASN